MLCWEMLVTWGLVPLLVVVAAARLGCGPGRLDRFFTGSCMPLMALLSLLAPRGSMGAGRAAAATLGFGLLVVALYVAFTPSARRCTASLMTVMAAVSLALVSQARFRPRFAEDGWGWRVAVVLGMAVVLATGWGTAWLLSRLRATSRRDPGPPHA